MQITSGFELYAVFSPLASKQVAIAGVNRLLRWIKKEEDRLFIINSLTIWPSSTSIVIMCAMDITRAFQYDVLNDSMTQSRHHHHHHLHWNYTLEWCDNADTSGTQCDKHIVISFMMGPARGTPTQLFGVGGIAFIICVTVSPNLVASLLWMHKIRFDWMSDLMVKMH